MPNAQGHITVRRRPKDGDNGADAVDYKFIPSAYSIVLQKDGTLRPSALSARLVKKIGESPDVEMTAQAFDGYTARYQIKKSDGNLTSGYTPGTSLNLTAYASTLQSVDFELLRDNKAVASISVPCIASGIDGEDAYLLDLDNEMEGIPCNASGTPTGTGTLATAQATVYKGSKADTGWAFSKSDSGCTSSIDTNGKVSVSAISADRASVTVIATKGSMTREAVMSLYKVKAGAPGTSPTVYSIEVSDSAISRDKDGKLNPTTITAYKVKTTGNSTARTKEMILKYMREGQDTIEIALSNNSMSEGGEIKGLSDACTAVTVALYAIDGTTVLDKERIPVVKDGSDGKDGEDAYVLDLDNEVQGIPCNASGTPTGTGTLATTNSTVYKGSKVDSGWAFSKKDSGCTSSIDTNGKVSVTAISADRASVTVIATKGSMTREAVMSIYKVKAGSNGTSPTVYSIDTSVSALRRDASGNLDPSSFTAYKQKTTGSTTSRTTEKTLKYKRNGQDNAEITLSGEGGEIKDISAACTSVSLILYDGTTVLDSETLPILKDGEKGDPAVSYWLVPSVTQVSKNASGTLTPNSVSCRVMKQVGDGAAAATTELFALYQITNENGTAEPAKAYTPGATVAVTATTKQILFQIYRTGTVASGVASGSGTAMGSVTIGVVTDGQQGMPGMVRAPLRVREWAKLGTGTEFTSGKNEEDEWTDIVYELTDKVEAGVKYWRAKKKFSKESGQQLPASEDACLAATSSFGSLATDIFLAHYALIKNLGVEAIEMRDGSGNLMFVAKDGTVTCNTGNFKNIHISGSSTFKGFMFRDKFLVTADNYPQITKKVMAGTWDGEDQYYTLLDLEKTGNWIEVKSLPTNYAQAYFAWLPSIRIGEAYTDTYRDYVRQYMGNEIVIYNSSTKNLGIDTGANSVAIERDMACRFRMVLDAQKMGGTGPLLERIVWEYSEPFQF